MANWSRISLIVEMSIFFSWCVGFFAWPCLPRPKPLMVLARMTVGWPLCFTAAAYAAYLVRIVAAAVQAPDVLVAHARDELQRFGMLAEEMLAHEGAVVRLVVLVFAVDRLLHDAQENAVLVAREQRIPVRAPDHLDHVPAGAAEVALELLDDLAVAAHRPSRRCRLQFTTKIRLSSFSRAARPMAPIDSGSSISPSPQNTQTLRFAVCARPRAQVPREPRHVDRLDRPRPIDTWGTASSRASATDADTKERPCRRLRAGNEAGPRKAPFMSERA